MPVVVVIEIEGPAGLVLDALARLQLAARRWDGAIRVCDAEPALVALLETCGLDRALCGERPWEVERAEQPHVQEGVDPDDSAG